jgi:hypothetical protein
VGDHPVKVPPELFTEWLSEDVLDHGNKPGTIASLVADKAAQWGADQELEACCEWLQAGGYSRVTADRLRAARRRRPPKPPSLAEQGMAALRSTACTEQRHYDAMFAALDRLAELEAQQ